MSDEPKFKFKNLQPINYLKNFNKMLEYNEAHPQRQPRKGELKVQSLSRFPLPKYYYNMEGIFENNNKKKTKEVDHQQIIQKQQEQEFLKKHYQFMKKAITKIIADNEDTKNILQKYKKNYLPSQSSRKISTRLRSQKKLKKNTQFNNIAKEIISQQNQSKKEELQHKSNDIDGLKQQINKNPAIKMMPKKKKEKFRERDDDDLQKFLESRKEFYQSRQGINKQIQENPESKQIKQDQEKEKTLVRKIVQLQYRQNDYQKNYIERTESAIKKFHLKVDDQIQSIQNAKFW